MIQVWDLPTRLFHWAYAAAFTLAWITSGDDRLLDPHVYAGYLMLLLLAFRLVWGFSGSRHARFSSFNFSLAAARNYLRATWQRAGPRHVGHNPAGAWAVYLLLLSGFIVCLSGILTLGGEEQHGSLRGFIGFAAGATMHLAHEAIAYFMLALVVVHLGGVAFESRAHRENLAKAMLTGKKRGEHGEAIAQPHLGAAILLAALIIGFTALYFRPYFTAGKTPIPFKGEKLADDPLWREECGSCHLAFHPSLLPGRSWRKIMQQQDAHFGEALGIDSAVAARLLAFAQANSAEGEKTETAYKILHSIPLRETPLRISETPYWQAKHREIPPTTWKNPKVGSKANCPACHLDAEQGTFEDGAMRLPR